MKAKHVWWSATALVVAAAVGGTAALGVTLQREYGDLSHGEAQAVEAPEEPLSAAQPGEANLDALSAKLDELAKNKDLSLIHISEPTRPCGTSRMPSSA